MEFNLPILPKISLVICTRFVQEQENSAALSHQFLPFTMLPSDIPTSYNNSYINT
jgi:hypothetical protein